MNISDYINRDELNERLDGDFELFRELADIFLTDADSLIGKIDAALSASNAEAVGKSAHTLKGAVSNFSAMKAFNAALALEKIGKSGDLTSASEALVTVKSEVNNALNAIKGILSEGSIL